MVNLVAVKLFGTAVRGRLDTSGWVSIIATQGKVLFERVGDLQLTPGTYRAAAPLTLYASKGGEFNGSTEPSGDVELTSVAMGDDGVSIWGCAARSFA